MSKNDNHGIIWIHVGRCGNQISIPLWRRLLLEHNLTKDGQFSSETNNSNDNISICFDEISQRGSSSSKFVPRAVFVDNNSSCSDLLKSSDISNIFLPDNFPKFSTMHSSPRPDPETIDSSLDMIRRQVENCDLLDGFHIIHSLGGFTGSFSGTLLLSKLREEYSDRIFFSTSIFPSPKVSDVVIEPYNAILNIHQLIENADFVNAIDNECLYTLSQDMNPGSSPNYSDLNLLTSLGIAEATKFLRFSAISGASHWNMSLRDLAMFLTPFPRLHFLSLTFPSRRVPGTSIFDIRNSLSLTERRGGKYLGAFANLTQGITGDQTLLELDQLGFVDWIPHNFKWFGYPQVVNSEHSHLPLENGLLLSNTTSIQSLFSRLESQFSMMWKRKAFLGCFSVYSLAAFDEMEFVEAQSNVRDLLAEYQQYQECSSFPESHKILKSTLFGLHNQLTSSSTPTNDPQFYDSQGNASAGWKKRNLDPKEVSSVNNIRGIQMDFFWKVKKTTHLPFSSRFQLLPTEIISHIVDLAIPKGHGDEFFSNEDEI